MRDVVDLISHWQPTPAPALTWYGDGERVELSGRVASNWVIKAANLLTDEGLDSADQALLVDLPVHWRALVWGLAGWLVGARVEFGSRISHPGGSAGPFDAVVTDAPDEAPEADLVIAVALGAFAMSAGDGLPPGVMDGSAELMTHPDVLMGPPNATDLSQIAGERSGEAQRVLLRTQDPAVVRSALAVWLDGGSLVLVGDGESDLDQIASSEGATRP